jgi:hypothetical protein
MSLGPSRCQKSCLPAPARDSAIQLDMTIRHVGPASSKSDALPIRFRVTILVLEYYCHDQH